MHFNGSSNRSFTKSKKIQGHFDVSGIIIQIGNELEGTLNWAGGGRGVKEGERGQVKRKGQESQSEYDIWSKRILSSKRILKMSLDAWLLERKSKQSHEKRKEN